MDRRPLAQLLERRAELLAEGGDPAELDTLTAPLADMMRGGELVVRRLTLDEPVEVLERLVAAEPVHPFVGRDDLADRLDDDRRCFVLEHPELVGRPLNVVWCALWSGVADDIGAILDPSLPTADPLRADTAIFYSIWNVEPGLVGLPGGRTLLHGAMAALSDELPGLDTFATLSPVPGFRRWLEERASAGTTPVDTAGEGLLASCARYLVTLRDDGRPLDPVARFHLGNGARLLSLCPAADRSERGAERSFGIMANYRYEPEDRAANRAALRDGHPVVGNAIASLVDLTGRR